MGQIINGVYSKTNAPMQDAVPRPTSVWKQGDHARQRADHQLDLLSPFDKDGKLSDEFIQQYPDEAVASYGFNPDKNLELNNEK
jgi:hypothetical protein